MSPRGPLKPLFRFLLQPYWRLTRAQTLGVRAVVRDDQGRVLLVRHSYVPGWHFPGGGVDHGETLEQALARELGEEVGIVPEGRPALVGVFSNARSFPRDHVALYLVTRYRQQPANSREIAEFGFFAGTDLPEETTAGTRRRLEEIEKGAAPDILW